MKFIYHSCLICALLLTLRLCRRNINIETSASLPVICLVDNVVPFQGLQSRSSMHIPVYGICNLNQGPHVRPDYRTTPQIRCNTCQDLFIFFQNCCYNEIWRSNLVFFLFVTVYCFVFVIKCSSNICVYRLVLNECLQTICGTNKKQRDATEKKRDLIVHYSLFSPSRFSMLYLSTRKLKLFVYCSRFFRLCSMAFYNHLMQKQCIITRDRKKTRFNL